MSRRHHGSPRKAAASARQLLAASLAISSAALSLPSPSLAQQAEAKAYQIPAGKLDQALTRFAAESGIELSFDAALTNGKSSAGLSGDYGVDEGLALLLQGQGLQVLHGANGSYSLRPAAQATDGAVLMQAVKVESTAVNSSTEGTGSYTTPQTSRGKGGSLRQTPQSITVVTAQRIEDQNLKTIADVMEQVPGVTVQNGFFGSSERSYVSRGFTISNAQIDGSAAAAALNGYDYNPNLLEFERVEVIRGADGLFAGNGEPGGSINMVRKRAPEEAKLSVEATAGRWNRYQGVVDAGSPLGFGGKLRGRVVGSYLDADSFMDIVDERTRFFYATVEADLTSSTLLIVGASYEKRNGHNWSRGLPRYSDGRDLQLSRSTALITPWSRMEGETTEYFARLEQQLGKDWSLTVAGTRTDYDSDYRNAPTYGAVDPITLTGPYRFLDTYIYQRDLVFYDAYLSGSFEWFGRRHQLVVGTDGQEVDPRYNSGYRSASWVNSNVDVFNPYDNLPAEPTDWTQGTVSIGSNKQRGVYAKLQFALTDRLDVIAGGRRASFDQSRGDNYYSESGIFTPYGGLVYDIAQHWTVYGSVTDIYKSQADRLKGPLDSPSSLDPIEGRNLEIGTKAELFDGQLNASFALYRVKRNGEAVSDGTASTDTGHGIQCCYLDDGRVLSQGVDTEIAGEVLPGLQLTAGYTYNDNENKATSVPYSTITPKHLFKLWSTYRLPGDWSAVDVGGGVNVQSQQYNRGTVATYNEQSGKFDGPTMPFEFTQGGYAIWNLRAGYRIEPHWSLSLNANNLFDKTYYRTVGTTASGNWYGEPRNWMLTLRGRW